MHVVGLVRGVRDQRVQGLVVAGDLVRRGRVVGLDDRGFFEVVGRQEGQQVAGEVDAVLLVLGLVVGHAGPDGVRVRPAQLLEGDLLTGHRLDHVRAGDEHVRCPVHHEREVGDRRRVDRAARARPHDQRDLRDHARGHHVPVEDLPEQAERDHTLLDPGPAAVVDADDRAADLQRVVHHLDDLGAVDLAERPAEHREVLAEHADRAAVYRAVPGDHAVAVRPVLFDAEVGGPVPGELVELHERARVQQLLDPLPRGQLSPRVLLPHRLRGAGVHGLLAAPLQVGNLPGGRVRVRIVAAGAGARLRGGMSGHGLRVSRRRVGVSLRLRRGAGDDQPGR